MTATVGAGPGDRRPAEAVLRELRRQLLGPWPTGGESQISLLDLFELPLDAEGVTLGLSLEVRGRVVRDTYWLEEAWEDLCDPLEEVSPAVLARALARELRADIERRNLHPNGGGPLPW